MPNPEFPWQAHVEKVRAKGVLAKQLYAVLTWPAAGMEPILKNLQNHLAYQVELEREGIMFGAGPFADDDETEWSGEGMVIIRAASLGEARKIAEADPMHESGARKFRVRPWLLNEGSLTLKVTFSDGKREVV